MVDELYSLLVYARVRPHPHQWIHILSIETSDGHVKLESGWPMHADTGRVVPPHLQSTHDTTTELEITPGSRKQTGSRVEMDMVGVVGKVEVYVIVLWCGVQSKLLSFLCN